MPSWQGWLRLASWRGHRGQARRGKGYCWQWSGGGRSVWLYGSGLTASLCPKAGSWSG